MDESYDIAMTYRPENGAPLHQTITCDRETAIAWLESVIEELKNPPERPKPARTFQLRIGGHPMSLDYRRQE